MKKPALASIICIVVLGQVLSQPPPAKKTGTMKVRKVKTEEPVLFDTNTIIDIPVKGKGNGKWQKKINGVNSDL